MNDKNELEMKEMAVLIKRIKRDILSTRNKIIYEANNELISLYYRIGKVISENQKYGSNFIKTLSVSLKVDFPDTTGFSPRNLARMKKFYDTYKNLSILPMALAKLPWSFNCLLIDRVKDINEKIWYAEQCFLNGWSYVVFNYQIDLNLYDRQANNTKKLTNFQKQLPPIERDLAINLIKDPYIFELTGISEKSKERDIEKVMLEKIKTVLLELGKGFSFVANQYRICTDGKDYYVDLLFYNLKLKCYVVVELKNADFDPTFIGQLSFYVTAIDETIKQEDDNKTIGLLLCKNKDRCSVEWSLKSSLAPISVSSYRIRDFLPTENEINLLLKNK